MVPVFRPFDAGVPPDRLAHRRRHDGVVTGGKGKHGAGKIVFSLSRVPMHQPIEPFIEACDIERFRPGEACRAAGPPEGLKRSAGLALETALQRGDARGRDVAAEAIEALDADQALEAAISLLEQP